MADAWIRGWQSILAGNDVSSHDKHHKHDGGGGGEQRERRKEDKNRHYCDAEKYPEWADERVSALPLAGAVKEGKPEKLGKGKQAKTLKTTFKLASGETTVAVVKELKRDRNWQFFLHNEYVSLARISASPSPPSEIPKVLAVFRDKAQVVVELFECKGDLYSLGHPKDAATAVRWWWKLAGAVSAANSLQVFHCDVNPSNVLVDATGERLLLVDWACSRQEASESTKVTNAKRGHYQPGEMMKGFVGPQTDVFGVAACLLWFLTGRTPQSKAISGEDGRQRTPASIAAIVKDWLPGGGSEELSEILFSALAEDVSERVSSVDELMGMVHAWEGKYGGSL